MSGRRGDWLCTHSGTSFYPLDPRPDEIHIEDIAHALSMLCRFGGHCSTFYSVAEHSVRVARQFMVRTRFRDDGTGPGTPDGCLAALLHDASEAYIIDVPRPLKPYLGDYKVHEAQLQQAIFKRFGALDCHHAAIKTCDLILLATEKRDLMPATSAEWAPLPSPLSEPIVPWTQEKAKQMFLGAFERLSAMVRR